MSPTSLVPPLGVSHDPQQSYQWMMGYFQRLIGAQFQKSLKKILVFGYPRPITHLFHTMWCPPLRVVVLKVNDAADEGEVLYDQVVSPWRFISLPAGHLVLEMNPDDPYEEFLPMILSDFKNYARDALAGNGLVGGTDPNISVDNLIFAMFADALKDLKSLKQTSVVDGVLDPATLVARYTPWERGNLVASAGFVLEYRSDSRWLLPRGAVTLSRDLIRHEEHCSDELLAAANAAVPSWRNILPYQCIGCGNPGSWRPVFSPPSDALPAEKSWRFLRPENNVPLCRMCARRFRFTQNEEMRIGMCNAFWGARFSAFHRWVDVELNKGEELVWDKGKFPLWPENYGGETWETGSGALKHVLPVWPRRVNRNKEQRLFLRDLGIDKHVYGLEKK